MTFDELQAEVERRANDMTADVLVALWHRLEERLRIGDDIDVRDYIALINTYAHCRIYEHKLEVATRDYSMYELRGTSYRLYNNQLNSLWKVRNIIRQMNERKHELRDYLRMKGIKFKEFHPSFHKLDMSRLPLMKVEDVNVLDKSSIPY